MTELVPYLIPAKFPIPDGYILACPSCLKYKLYEQKMLGQIVFKCAGKKECGKIFTKTYVELFVGQMMVKE